ncbi:PA domain-containing protein [Plasmodiophora brassicae]
MRALLAGVCLAAAACATFDVIDSVEGFGSVSLYSPAISATVGPQKPLTNPFEGVIRVVVTDPCDPSDRGDLKDKIVVLGLDPPSTCSYEKMYLHFQAAGAKAVLFSKSRVTPGYNLYRRDAQLAAVTSRMDMMFLQISPSRKLHAALKTGMRARVSPDPNVWKPVFGSWYYQTFLRFLPGCVLIAAGLAAATFLTMHIRLISDSFLAQYSVERRTMRRRVTYIWERISGLQLMILLTEAVSATILGLALVIGGWCSTSNLPAPVVLYFMTAMSGEGFACSKMAAIVWNRKLHETFPVEKPSVMTRLFRGDWWWGSAALCLVPLSISTALSILMSQYHRTTAFQALVTATFLALQILVGSHIIYEVCRYHREVSRVAKSVQGTVNTTAVNTFLRRISRCVLMLSMSMAMQVVASLIIICFLQFFFSPPGWTIAYGLFLNGRAVDSASRVAMFRPIRRNNAPADGSRFTSPAKSSATSSIMRSKRTAGTM